ncbi:MAG: DUF2971 domain-containing protein [Bacillota bacterium]
MTMPKLIYHYCDVKTFMNIIKSKKLWLSNSNKMNDFRENTWINQFIDEKINNIKSEYKNFKNNFIRSYKINIHIPYIACFSENGDLLSQWRAYASDGKGIAIGFDSKKMKLEEKVPTVGDNTNINLGLYKTTYEKEKQRKIVNSMIDFFIDGVDNEVWDENGASSLCAAQLKKYSCVLKNPAFSEEQEWRIIHTPFIAENPFFEWDEDSKVESLGQVSDIHFRSRGSEIISYFKLSLDDHFSNGLISKVILGPKCKLDKYDFGMYLKMNNLDNVDVITSNASYR